MTKEELMQRMRDMFAARNPFDWKRPDNIDAHHMRYHPLESAIESIILTRMFEKKLDGYVLETAVQIAEAAQLVIDMEKMAARNEALEEAALKLLKRGESLQ